jgi:DivIVA domain-containing protein
VALDRDSIARRDFPSQRRGYDPAAVDAHLRQIADEVADLQRRASGAPLSSQAGAQVKAIVEAAERSADEIRDQARAQGREHIAHVTAAAERLRARIEQMETDVTQLTLDLRTNAERLMADLVALREGAGELAGAEHEQPEPEPAAPQPAASGEPPASAEPSTGGDAAAARIVALDMALSGTPREETDRYLSEHYDVPDRAALLDEVYAAAEA